VFFNKFLGQPGFVASRSEVVQTELRVADPIRILAGEQTLPWRLESKGLSRPEPLHTMFCCEAMEVLTIAQHLVSSCKLPGELMPSPFGPQ